MILNTQLHAEFRIINVRTSMSAAARDTFSHAPVHDWFSTHSFDVIRLNTLIAAGMRAPQARAHSCTFMFLHDLYAHSHRARQTSPAIVDVVLTCIRTLESFW